MAYNQHVFCKTTGEIYSISQYTDYLEAQQENYRYMLDHNLGGVSPDHIALHSKDLLEVVKFDVDRGFRDYAREELDRPVGEKHRVYLKDKAERIYGISENPEHAMADDIMAGLGFEPEKDYIYLDSPKSRQRDFILGHEQRMSDREAIARVMHTAERIRGDDEQAPAPQLE